MNQAKVGATEVWSYSSGNGETVAAATGNRSLLTAVSTQRFCTVNVNLTNGVVNTVNYLGPTGGLLTAGDDARSPFKTVFTPLQHIDRAPRFSGPGGVGRWPVSISRRAGALEYLRNADGTSSGSQGKLAARSIGRRPERQPIEPDNFFPRQLIFEAPAHLFLSALSVSAPCRDQSAV